ncbi:hypothetical protein ACFWBB_38560 [Streptomyces sp. NPDC060000]|uniref:hypothetical protein n=1 Tax=Streptomyces sp. NPDC060000 TaxID=3347031 RepID=UPI003675F95F
MIRHALTAAGLAVVSLALATDAASAAPAPAPAAAVQQPSAKAPTDLGLDGLLDLNGDDDSHRGHGRGRASDRDDGLVESIGRTLDEVLDLDGVTGGRSR